jgi:hypothetical protein
MRSFILGAIFAIGGLFYAHQTYGTLKPCDMLAKERAADATGGSDGILGLAAEVWQSQKVEDMWTGQCATKLSVEWWTNAMELAGFAD